MESDKSKKSSSPSSAAEEKFKINDYFDYIRTEDGRLIPILKHSIHMKDIHQSTGRIWRDGKKW